jgi:DNA modification methylase
MHPNPITDAMRKTKKEPKIAPPISDFTVLPNSSVKRSQKKKSPPSSSLNQLYYGDNLEVLRKYIKDESVDLCYIDPPFNSKRNYNQIYNNIGSEDRAQAQAFVDTWTWDDAAEKGLEEIILNFNGVFTHQSIDLIVGLQKVLGKGSLLSYLVHMSLRIAEIHRVLKSTGSFYLHCDPNASHYLKLVLDAIFCAKGGDFRNEIIWDYTFRLMDLPKFFNRKHDVILFYAKGKHSTFNMPKIEWTREALLASRKQKIHVDENGVEWIWMPGGKGNSKNKLRKIDEIIQGGKAVSDVWQMPIISSSSKERLGYPTQKPEALLERIIQASSNEGDTILDAYCGCGTTVAVAERLKRKWIGIDITYQSISLILKRLEEHFSISTLNNIRLSGVPEDFESAVALANKRDDKTRKEFEKWAVLTYSNNRGSINEKKGGDGGIDGYAYVYDSNDKQEQEVKEVIFSVKSNKILSPSVVRDLNGTMERDGAIMGILITLYKMDNLTKECRKYGLYTNKMFAHKYPKIQVVSIEEILAGERMNIPISLKVLKNAEQRNQNKQQQLEF